MLQNRSSEVKDRITAIFKTYVDSTYGRDIAGWCYEYWRNIEEQQFNVMRSLKGQDHASDILILSLIVQIDDITFFVKYTAELVQRSFM